MPDAVADATELLERGEMEIRGRMPWSSNGTYLVTVHGGGQEIAAIYKPWHSERPLWDFPGGLFRREVAAYELARQLGWDLIPQTVRRLEGPLGEGSLQRFVDADFEQHYFTLLDDRAHHRELRRMCALDLVANNADRKGGHCLVDRTGHLWGIDHGLCFHVQPKVRTVIWDFAGDDIDEDVVTDLQRLGRDGPSPQLRSLLDEDECKAISTRVRKVLRSPVFPEPRTDHPYPWPLV